MKWSFNMSMQSKNVKDVHGDDGGGGDVATVYVDLILQSVKIQYHSSSGLAK